MKKFSTLFVITLLFSVGAYAQSWLQQGSDLYGGSNDFLGDAISLSADGKVLATGASSADAGGTGKGLVKVFTWNGASWSQKGSNLNGAANSDAFGAAVSLDSTGNTLAVGSPFSEAGFGSFSFAGTVRIYSWSGSAWAQKGSDIDAQAANDNCGYSVSLSKDGNTVAIGSPGNAGGGTARGRTRVFTWSGSAWVQKGSNINGEGDYNSFGTAVSLDSSGNNVAIGAPLNAGGGTDAGHVRVFTWSGSAWAQQGSDIDGDASTDNLGTSVKLSMDGKRLAVGAPQDFLGGYGYVKIYDWSGSAWVQKSSNITSVFDGDEFGYALDISGNGNYVAIGARNGVVGNENGRAQVYNWGSSSWQMVGDTIFGKNNYDAAGQAVAIDHSGLWLSVGAPSHSGSSMGSGQVRVFNYTTCQTTDSTFSELACDSFTWRGNTYHSSGTYTDTLTNMAGCDSVLILKLTLNTVNSQTLTVKTCGVYTAPSGKIFTTSGTYNDTLRSTLGCDSIIYTINLDLISTQFITTSGTICGIIPYISPTGKKYYVGGSFKDTLRNSGGTCDSIIYSISLAKLNPATEGFALSNDTFTEVSNGTFAHGDIDKDGDEDIFISGYNELSQHIAELYINDGQNNFSLLSGTSFTGMLAGSASIIDLDGDTLPEIFISGIGPNNLRMAKLYKNNGGGSFSLVTSAPFDTLRATLHQFADVDNDGDMDLLISVEDGILLYKNNNGSFSSTYIKVSNTSADNGFLIAADLNGDGYVDIVKAGNTFTGTILPTEVYLNDKTGNSFTISPDPFDDFILSKGAIADMNKDNIPDVVIGGLGKDFQFYVRIYANDGSAGFTLIDSTSMTMGLEGTLSVVDIENDGDNDVLTTGGQFASEVHTTMYLKDDKGRFLNASGLPLEDLTYSSAMFFDMDNDGYQDLLISGVNNQQQKATRLYRNQGCFSPCVTESELNVKSCGPYTSPSGKFVWTESGTYLDTLIKGNAAGCDSFITIHLTTNSLSAIAAVACDSFIAPSGNIYHTSGEYTDTLKGMNQFGCDSIIRISLNMSSSGLISNIAFKEMSATIPSIVYSGVGVIDYDGDGKNDFLVNGWASGAITELYKNNGDNSFTKVANNNLPKLAGSKLAIADLDGDGMLDVLIAGEPSYAAPPITKLFKNNGDGTFTEMQGAQFEGVSSGAVAIADLNRDGLPDVVIVGKNSSYNYIFKIYKNDGGGNFSEVTGTTFIPVEHCTMVIEDTDGDNLPEIFISGYSDTKVETHLYKNNGNFNFSETTGNNFAGVSRGGLVIEDLDGDGKKDLLN